MGLCPKHYGGHCNHEWMSFGLRCSGGGVGQIAPDLAPCEATGGQHGHSIPLVLKRHPAEVLLGQVHQLTVVHA